MKNIMPTILAIQNLRAEFLTDSVEQKKLPTQSIVLNWPQPLFRE